MRLADADLIPFEYTPQADTIAKYVTELEKMLKDKQDEFPERNLEIRRRRLHRALLIRTNLCCLRHPRRCPLI